MANTDSNGMQSLSPAAFSILLALKGGEKHGYAILKDVSDRSQGQMKLLPGTLYNLLKRMLEDGWIEELDERPDPAMDDERRRYYRLTAAGERAASLEAQRMQTLVTVAVARGLITEAEPN
jgi:DNA-binding PadR family transcriptional regulator